MIEFARIVLLACLLLLPSSFPIKLPRSAAGEGTEMSRMLAVDFEVFGIVQGVFFRKETVASPHRKPFVADRQGGVSQREGDLQAVVLQLRDPNVEAFSSREKRRITGKKINVQVLESFKRRASLLKNTIYYLKQYYIE
ncbi:PREDICTED: uncharacterized protein LOC105454426 isoform X1 [Wasmannia auropunctata]|uniref:uncharacterized protein LOC105454426 isoform X1 n=1 Tax=Wasmannia auropunctata TaxID=64793 RepID=UPI0005EE5922|nr:PREDICTED: uncharacterized protein LOC105454426 isoform X1 [Wasmannia auropunctata]